MGVFTFFKLSKSRKTCFPASDVTLREIHVFTLSPGVSELVLKGGAWKKWPFITIFQLKILVPESTKHQHQIKVHKISTELLP